MKTVLVTAIGSFSADAVITSLKKQGIRVIGCDIYPKEWIVDAYSVDLFYQVPRGTDRDRYLLAIKSICAENSVDYIMPLTDVEIDTLNDRRDWFANNGITICFSSRNTIDICRNKLKTYRNLKRQGFESILIPSFGGEDYEKLEESLFPVICKPINGRSSQGIKRISTKQELISFFQFINHGKFIIQPILDGSVVTVDVVRSSDMNSAVAIPRKELLRTLSGAGTSVYVFFDEELVKLCVRLAEALNVTGCVNFEFIQTSDGAYHFLECNPRFSGGVKFSCMIGYDCVQNHLNCFRGKDIDALRPFRPSYIARKYEEMITFAE